MLEFSKKVKKGQGTIGARNDVIRLREKKNLSWSSLPGEGRQS